jgi:cell division initiation protein
MEIDEIEGKKFRTRLMGLDPGEVEAFLQDMAEEIGRLKAENENLKRELQTQELEIREHKEREKTIRNVLITAQKNAEQTRTNAEREAKLIISEAEVKAESLLQEANNRLVRMGQEISEMRRNRIQFGAKMRSLLDAFRQMLDEDGKDAPKSSDE